MRCKLGMILHFPTYSLIHKIFDILTRIIVMLDPTRSDNLFQILSNLKIRICKNFCDKILKDYDLILSCIVM